MTMKKENQILLGLQKIFLVACRKNYKLLYRLFLNYAWAFFKIPSFVPRPLELQVEPSLRCNLKCRMCNINKDIKADSLMTTNNFNSLLKKILPMKAINFTGMGEALLNTDLETLILEANIKNIDTLFITNAQLLTPSRIDRIIASKLNKLCISMESGDPKTYESIRYGASFNKLDENVKMLTKKIKEANSDLKVSINVVLLKQNLEDITNIYKIIDFARQAGVTDITMQNPHDVFSYETIIYFTKKKNSLKKKFKLIGLYGVNRNIKLLFPPVDIKEGSCYYPWVYPQITASGELLPCCIMPQFADYSEIINNYSFGNVFAGDFSKAWNSPKAYLFRKSLADKKPNKYCQRCSKYLGIL